MNIIAQKMGALTGLEIPSIVQIDSTTAMRKIPPDWELIMDVSVPSFSWKLKHNEAFYDWKNSDVPVSVKETSQLTVDLYTNVLMDLIETTRA